MADDPTTDRAPELEPGMTTTPTATTTLEKLPTASERPTSAPLHHSNRTWPEMFLFRSDSNRISGRMFIQFVALTLAVGFVLGIFTILGTANWSGSDDASTAGDGAPAYYGTPPPESVDNPGFPTPNAATNPVVFVDQTFAGYGFKANFPYQGQVKPAPLTPVINDSQMPLNGQDMVRGKNTAFDSEIGGYRKNGGLYDAQYFRVDIFEPGGKAPQSATSPVQQGPLQPTPTATSGSAFPRPRQSITPTALPTAVGLPGIVCSNTPDKTIAGGLYCNIAGSMPPGEYTHAFQRSKLIYIITVPSEYEKTFTFAFTS